MILDDLIKNGQCLAAYAAARYCYRMGLPTLDDETYDKLEIWLRENKYEECKAYLERSYDDDPIPRKLLEVLGIEIIETNVSSELYSYLEDEKSNSIKAVRDMSDVYDFVQSNPGCPVMMSLKLDGVNSKMLYKDKRFALALSRGRHGNSINYTDGCKHIVPPRIDSERLLKITGECFVTPSVLPDLRKKYDVNKYKTSKSSAISLLRVEHEKVDYEDLNLLAFSCEGEHFSTVSEMYEYLETIGFKTPPHVLVNSLPSDYEEFNKAINEILDNLAEEGEGLPSDGVVMEFNDLESVFEEKNQYSERQIAIKFGHWGFEYLKGVITDIVVEQQRVYKSVRVKIEPVRSSDGCEANYINAFNPDILISNGLNIGSEVYFERNSGAVNILIHGNRLLNLKEGSADG